MAQTFVKEFAAENEKTVRGIAPEAMKLMLDYNWPGNVRELRTAMEHAVVLTRGETILGRDLPVNLRSGQSESLTADGDVALGDLTVKEAEKQLIIKALKENNGNRSEAARKLGMSRRTMHRKLHVYHLEDM